MKLVNKKYLEDFIEQERMVGINSQITAMTKRLFSNDSQSEQQLRRLAEHYIKLTGPIDRYRNSLSPIDACRLLEMR